MTQTVLRLAQRSSPLAPVSLGLLSSEVLEFVRPTGMRTSVRMQGSSVSRVERLPMASGSAIEWTEATWNPVTGCDRVSPGCAHCYALDLAARLKRFGQAKYQIDGARASSGPGFAVTLHRQTLDVPLRWKKPRVIFVNSMSDLFHEEVPLDFIQEIFDVMSRAERHVFQILTKRHERLLELAPLLPWPPNVWMGVSIENRRFVHRADYLRGVPAAVKFISAEPLLGPLEDLDLEGIDWLIAGGESGPKHRPVKEEWLIDLRDMCLDAEVPFFFKQWGGLRPKSGGRLLGDREWNDMPSSVVAVA
jgi:protein gp37